MESFVSRKKRKICAADADDGDESTDFKLALLSSLHPSIDQHALLDILLAHDGCVEEASASLKGPSGSPPPRKSSAAIGHQSSLSSFLVPSSPRGNGNGNGNHQPEKSAVKKAKLLARKGKTLHLYSPEDVAAHTPCSIIHNFLPADEANALLVELLAEASTFERTSFKLFDNVVQSPHTACLYVPDLEEQTLQKTEYFYNGARLEDVRQLTPHLRHAASLVQTAVNQAIQTRPKLPLQSPLPWIPNAALVNCYAHSAESVGWHSDQLTYLGPRPVIASLSLGVAREFRVRRILPRDTPHSDPDPDPDPDPESQGPISIHLPHNTLLIMHASMQEEWKHSVAPARAIDPHPLAGTARINVTYRAYRPTLHPRLTPRCACAVPAVLRVVQRRRETCGRYFWMCYAGNVPGQKGCDFFEWARFDEDGDPIWKRGGAEVQADSGKGLGYKGGVGPGTSTARKETCL